MLSEVDILDTAAGWGDLAVVSGKLDVSCGLAREGIPCVLRTDPDGSNQEQILLDEDPEMDYQLKGLCVSGEVLHISAGTHILLLKENR